MAFSPNSLRTKIEAGIDNMKKVTIVQNAAFDFSGADNKINGMLKFELPYKVGIFSSYLLETYLATLFNRAIFTNNELGQKQMFYHFRKFKNTVVWYSVINFHSCKENQISYVLYL